MSCIDKTKIQQYIDMECSKQESREIEKHIENCNACNTVYKSQLKQSELIKSALNELSFSVQSPPRFTLKHSNRKSRTINFIVYALSAACVVLFALILTNTQNTIANTPVNYSGSIEYNSNKPIVDQPLKIMIIDPEGNRSEIYID